MFVRRQSFGASIHVRTIVSCASREPQHHGASPFGILATVIKPISSSASPGKRTFRDHLSQLKVLRKLSFRIDTRKDDASRRSGTANKLTVGSVEVQRIDGAIKQARHTRQVEAENKSGAQMLGSSKRT